MRIMFTFDTKEVQEVYDWDENDPTIKISPPEFADELKSIITDHLGIAPTRMETFPDE